MPRTLNTSIDETLYNDNKFPNEVSTIHTTHLPKPCSPIPSKCSNLSETAKHQIYTLISNNNTAKTATLNEEEQDAIDDGFLLCDVNTIQSKFQAWYILFPRIKPFFALKCNPDDMVSHVLGSSGDNICGFDCASISEIKLALKSCTYYKIDQGEGQGEDREMKDVRTKEARRRCVYANPQRARNDLDQALELGVLALTFDSVEELIKVKDAYERYLGRWENQLNDQKTSNDNVTEYSDPLQTQNQPAPAPEMILRIVVPDGNSTIPLGEKFGAGPHKVKQLTQAA
mmetsp:Transcript_4491/g.5837  ORF Transcript_4491/g.5837 Transcript_4491/m.5837 type:complete len:286 (+) Transcript_4491:163-1020(+)